jgi:Tfp pilus assembly protein PilV
VRSLDPDKRSCPARLRARCAAACAAGRSRLRAERGSALIEVLVGAVVLSIATVGLLNGLDGAQSAGAKNKARSTASALAEQDIERMRSMRVTDLPGYYNSRPVVVRGVTYTVVSRGSWSVDTGGPISCSNISRTAANVRIVSEVTSNASKGIVDQVSLVTPPPGTYATGEGRAIVKLVDQLNAPLSGVTVNLTGPGSFSGVTNALGCVVFPFIPIGNYTATATRLGYVDVDGASAPSQSLTVNQSQSTAVNFTMGNAATIQAQFDTLVGATTLAAQSRWLSVANSKLTVSPRLFTAGGTSPATTTQINATTLFPFTNGYSVYPGQCTANAAGAKTYIPGPGLIFQNWVPLNKLRMPSINIHVVNNATPTPANLTGATVMIEPSDYPTCPNVFPTQVSTNTTAGGSAALPNPGYPYGTYKLCAQNSGATLHGHGDILSSGAYGTGHVDDTINNATGGNNTITATTDGAIRIQVNQTGPCHGFPQNGRP